ncbi:C4-type zinc ribbon domain-containing protein [Gordonia sp. ABSL1-1]|uniref:zinc ribbon domain-containing protein n=1 Tax=Gordonia sp. ABSL1-1 TaxID=3053923 RepID=UPI002573A3CB|nr:C4-type zinc ribbon domain-containing protein [Gordonia sp. ABSL1-1]MDL9937328.1 C4-type zinc ribbon domain-containing protein [Gordonia sp. ABSL1-1]
MKVDAGAQRVLLELADADAVVARLTHRRKNLPQEAPIAEAEKAVDSARDDLVRSEIAAEDVTREYRRIESEVTGMVAREAKDSAALTAGGLAPKALSELQHELAGLGRRRGVLEDEMLSLLEQQEAVDGERDRAAATIDHLRTQLTELETARDTEAAEVDAELAAATTRRETIAAEVDPTLLPIYDKQRAQGRIGAGLLRARRCGACRMELDRGTLSGIAAATSDEVIRCEECGAILIRTHESGL